MSQTLAVKDSSHVETAGRAMPTWWVVFSREFTDLWIGGRAMILLILFSLLLGIMSWVLASNSELSLIPPKEMVWLALEAAIAVGGFIGLIIGADSFSGERERATLEALLLTPTSRRQIVVGKFLAAISAWPAAFIVAIPYLYALAQGDEVFPLAVQWGAILGSLLALACTAFGMLVSVLSNSNKASLFASLTVYLLLLLPTQFPGNAQTGTYGRLLKQVNPMESNNHFLEKILVNNRTLAEFWIWLEAPVLFFVITLGLLFIYAAPRLRLEAGRLSLPKLKSRRVVASLLVIICLWLALGASSAQALQPAHLHVAAEVPQLPVQIAIDTEYKDVSNGTKIEFNTTVTNKGTQETPTMFVAMNLINLGAGDPVDPEDWSPERTQPVDTIPAGESLEQAWEVNTILEGDYMVYMVLIPKPNSPNITSQPITSAGIHITVHPNTHLNPGGVLPVVLIMPVLLIAGMGLLIWRRRRSIDTGTFPTKD